MGDDAHRRRIRLTQEGRERLERELRDARERSLDIDEFLRQQRLRKCDLDAVTQRESRLEKERLATRINELEATLADARTLSAARVEASTVDAGAFVTLIREDTGEELVVQLVDAAEVAAHEHDLMRVSEASPVGRALLGRQVGERVHVPLGDGRELRYAIRGLRYGLSGAGGS